MRYAIPLLSNRISPRCTIAEALLVVEVDAGKVTHEMVVPSPGGDWSAMVSLLAAENVGTLVCGGISREARQDLEEHEIAVVENVAATAETVVGAICTDRLRPGFGFDVAAPVARRRGESCPEAPASAAARAPGIDCLACETHLCFEGRPCPRLPGGTPRPRGVAQHMLEAAADISCEDERVLCRLTELVYFGLEMGYKRVGLAFCWDLVEPARILVGVLRRFFEVVPVGCKLDGLQLSSARTGTDESGRARRPDVTCNPRAQARALDEAGCELNVMVGLCMGADCLFARTSRAPVTTLIVKDRSLANNPIGALYSHRYLEEAMRTPAPTAS